jgi:hypothetical protein
MASVSGHCSGTTGNHAECGSKHDDSQEGETEQDHDLSPFIGHCNTLSIIPGLITSQCGGIIATAYALVLSAGNNNMDGESEHDASQNGEADQYRGFSSAVFHLKSPGLIIRPLT